MQIVFDKLGIICDNIFPILYFFINLQSEDWGSEHSSTFIGKFLRRDSGIHEKKKKIIQRTKTGTLDDVNASSSQIKKPLIAKWKTGANKLNLSCSENDGK